MKKAARCEHSEFAKKFLNLSDRYHAWQVWSDFITLFAVALSNTVDRSNFSEREEMYNKIRDKYNEKEFNRFPELIADTVLAFEENPEQDFLGSMYMELELGNHWIGQFFTPYDVCQCIAEISSNDTVEMIDRDGYITLNDCACGAGATLIAGVHEIRRQLEKANSSLCWRNHVLVAAQDIDFTTGMMCYIQLSLLGCAGYVKIGNTLTDPMTTNDDNSKYWYTPYYFSNVWHYRRIFHSMDLLFRRNKE